MKRICLLKNTIQEYDWGSRTAIAELLGDAIPSPKPQAELWMGAHPKAPSMVDINGRWLSLKTAIEENPVDILGKPIAEKHGKNLPYLFKVLAAAKPLSIQAHPSLSQAQEGFERENELGIPVDAPNRNYKDAMHKPECICALTPFWALNGFRKIYDIVSNMRYCCQNGMAGEINALNNQPDSNGLKRFFEAMMTMDSNRKKEIIQQAVQTAEQGSGKDPMLEWVIALYKEYPDDIGTLSPLYLNLIRLSPGEAMFLSSGRLHAYLEGLGMELMANSDNVLRGGLTPKHMDVPELLKTLDFQQKEIEILTPKQKEGGERIYASKAEEFVLSVISVTDAMPFSSPSVRSVEIVICTDGKAIFSDPGTDAALTLKKGESALIPAAVARYQIKGTATLYKAAVPV